MNCLIETALLTHGLRSIANEELAQSWHCPDAILAWVDGGKLKLGPIGEYLPFRERSEELIRIDCDHLEEALQTGASGAWQFAAGWIFLWPLPAAWAVLATCAGRSSARICPP